MYPEIYGGFAGPMIGYPRLNRRDAFYLHGQIENTVISYDTKIGGAYENLKNPR